MGTLTVRLVCRRKTGPEHRVLLLPAPLPEIPISTTLTASIAPSGAVGPPGLLLAPRRQIPMLQDGAHPPNWYQTDRLRNRSLSRILPITTMTTNLRTLDLTRALTEDSTTEGVMTMDRKNRKHRVLRNCRRRRLERVGGKATSRRTRRVPRFAEDHGGNRAGVLDRTMKLYHRRRHQIPSLSLSHKTMTTKRSRERRTRAKRKTSRSRSRSRKRRPENPGSSANRYQRNRLSARRFSLRTTRTRKEDGEASVTELSL